MFVETGAISAPRMHYEQVVRDTLGVVWRQRRLVMGTVVLALAAFLVAFMFMAPRYTGEAIIQLDFVRNENMAGERLQSTAAVDATAVVDSSARIIRSRGTASAVVSALRLDQDPEYTRPSRLERALSHVWAHHTSTPRELAITRLMKQITVTNDPRSYLIAIAVTTSNPERAANLANWVASEYLRGRLRAQTTEAYAAAERELAGLSAVLGPRHPTYLSAQAKLERLKEVVEGAEKDVASDNQDGTPATDMVRFAAGQTLLPAEAVTIPSGPNGPLLFALTFLAALVLGGLLSLLAERRQRQRSARPRGH
ncbi:Wzz/FepE/Etk N-terminal domain-containing protein [Bradyrhizobium sp. UFLA03-84]|uniref:Wzz/FepE/Etk N-terminal domain-containing protein n=1 Tax=Bradyrhizobium sp. UFLA03-84 TaxID=418599 RepID=UPI0013043BEA|nr:Wzz/FepE/Etk N-terminal domain-containing protein [Bradyrhizobium sp. UFLA03-84]